MEDRQDFWFPVKSYGFGWGLPIRWQGWLILAAYLALLIVGLDFLHGYGSWLATLVYVIAITVALIAIIAIKGERPARWRWRGQ